MDKDLSGASVETFLDNLLEKAIQEVDKKATGWVSYDVVYGFEYIGREYTIIINITDNYELTANENEEDDYDIVNRKINSVIIQNDDYDEMNLDDFKSQLYDYAALHERIYEAFNTSRWSGVFEREGLESFKKQQHNYWNKFRAPVYAKGGEVRSFSEFQKETREELEKYLNEQKSNDFILDFVKEKFDTAHLYGMNEPKYSKR
ncbi:unnamed protein product [marine sediment metagenome]|uniref:Uncharacterized protein n=1 Tax=marine sediment metagenome TaxID=412755 RepID=X1BP08_9ZZZZ